MRDRRNGWTRRWSVAGLTLLVLAACGDDGNGPMEPTPQADIRGNYNVTHEIRITIGGFSQSLECPGSMTISTLDDQGNFTGQITFGVCPEAEIEEPITEAMAGTVSSSGVVRFDPGDLDALDDVFASLGCQVIRIDEAITGTFSGNTITATFSADLDCEDVEEQVVFTYRIMATKTT